MKEREGRKRARKKEKREGRLKDILYTKCRPEENVNSHPVTEIQNGEAET